MKGKTFSCLDFILSLTEKDFGIELFFPMSRFIRIYGLLSILVDSVQSYFIHSNHHFIHSTEIFFVI